MPAARITWLLVMLTLAPTRVDAFCTNEPDSVTLVDERLGDTPVTWVCDNGEDWWWEYQEHCDLDGSSPDLPQCPMVELPEILERLKVATGEDTSFLWYGCEQFVDCRLVRDLVPLDWEKEWSSCGLKNTEEVLDLADIGEFLVPGDLAATRNNCGSPSWRHSVIVDAGSPPQVKVLASDGGNWTAVVGRMVSWQKIGEPCCDPPEIWGSWFGEDYVHSSAIRFQVDGADDWTASAHSAHVFPASGLALRLHHSAFANQDVWIEDFEGSVRYDVFAWPPEGFQEVSVGDEWCQTRCDDVGAPDSGGDAPVDGSDGVGSGAAEPPGVDVESSSGATGCTIATGSHPRTGSGIRFFSVFALLLLLRQMNRIRYLTMSVGLILAINACTEVRVNSTGDAAPDTSVPIDVPADLSPTDVTGHRGECTPETVPFDVKEAEGNCHYDCLPGWYTCEDGEMIAAFYGPIPCWVNLTCEEAGNSWPCVSGVCGPHELCMDDIEYLESLVPHEVEWRAGSLELTSSSDSPSGHWSCFNSVCTWRITDGEETILKFSILGLGTADTETVDGTTHLISVQLPGAGVKDLLIEGSPVEVENANFVWAPLEEFTLDNNGSWPRMGYSGALIIDAEDGIRTVIVWLRESAYTTPVKVAIHRMDIAGDCQPPKPFLLDGSCVECLTTEDCKDIDLECNPENHRCEPEECNFCEDPYPACTQINDVWACVQCKYDEDCPEGVECEPGLYACEGGGEVFCNGCASDDDCQSIWSDFQLECDVASGCCRDVTGLCDGVEGFCPNGECKGLWSDVLGCGVWPTSDNEACETIDPGLGVCTCSAPVDIEDPASCPPPDLCAGGACPPEGVCVDASTVELMFGASAPFDAGVCLPLDWIVNEL